MTSRGSEFRHKYAIAGAGAVGKSFIGNLRLSDFGPVAGVSYRVASRIANGLRAGQPARGPADLNGSRTVLFHSPADQIAALIQIILSDQIEWKGKALIICDCAIDSGSLAQLRARGASIAAAREFGIAGYLAIQGTGHALSAAHRLARELHLKAIEVPDGAEHSFAAAITLSTTAFTPLVDRVAALLRHAGVRETEAPRLAAALFQKTAADYSHSGKQSWGWYMQGPEPSQLETEIAATLNVPGANLGLILRQLILLGLDVYDKHGEAGKMLSQPPD